jgi:hypothetical protein
LSSLRRRNKKREKLQKRGHASTLKKSTHMNDRESLEEKIVEGISRSIFNELETDPSTSLLSATYALAKMAVDEHLGTTKDEEEMEVLCADMDTFTQED